MDRACATGRGRTGEQQFLKGSEQGREHESVLSMKVEMTRPRIEVNNNSKKLEMSPAARRNTYPLSGATLDFGVLLRLRSVVRRGHSRRYLFGQSAAALSAAWLGIPDTVPRQTEKDPCAIP